MKTQITQEYLNGEFYLTGVHEMAAGFQFLTDFSFKFFYAYGASDRAADGKYEIVDNKVVLHGNKALGKDFNLLRKKQSGKGITIKIENANKMFATNVVCFLYADNEPIIEETNQQGIAIFEINNANRIELIHALFPDVPSTFDIKNESTNYFEFSLNPSLQEVVFDKAVLDIKENSFEFRNIYLFGNESFRFVKK